MEKLQRVRVLQGQSVCYGGQWYHQGSEFDCREGTKFQTNRAKRDAEGKHLGEEIVDQVEVLVEKQEAPRAQPAKGTKKEKEEE